MPVATLHCKDSAEPVEVPLAREATPAILVVEDDWRTRSFICTVLKYFAHGIVLEASSRGGALSNLENLKQPLDLLIADIGLAGASNGIDLARECGRTYPGMRVLLISGRDRPPAELPAAWRFLSKPFPTHSLLTCVSELCSKME